MIDRLFTLLALALVTATVTVNLTRASIFYRPRTWLGQKSKFIEKLLACPFCTSHWVAFAIVGLYRPQVLPMYGVVNFFAASFAIVTLTSFLIGGMFAAFQYIPAPQAGPEEEEDAA